MPRAKSFTISVALIVQIHLQQNRTDLALKEVQAARKWAQDSLLIRIAEAWVGLRVVSRMTFSSDYELEPSFEPTKNPIQDDRWNLRLITNSDSCVLFASR